MTRADALTYREMMRHPAVAPKVAAGAVILYDVLAAISLYFALATTGVAGPFLMIMMGALGATIGFQTLHPLRRDPERVARESTLVATLWIASWTAVVLALMALVILIVGRFDL